MDVFDIVLSPKEMEKLNEIGIDISNAAMYFSRTDIRPKTFYELKLKEIFPFELEKDDLNAYTYLEAKNILPRFIIKDDKTYFLTEIYDKVGTTLSYMFIENNVLLHTECNKNPCTLVFKMILWCKENEYLDQIRNKKFNRLEMQE